MGLLRTVIMVYWSIFQLFQLETFMISIETKVYLNKILDTLSGIRKLMIKLTVPLRKNETNSGS